ncbi:MAG: hypothetical protein MPN21_15395 [Thermoanaerobaculia bacterium]|nr:hypothetical protein [Thermoanaerobaculia bacterium]
MSTFGTKPGSALRIQTTWDGRPAAASEIVDLRVENSADSSALLVFVDAPFHDDPQPPGPPGPTPALWNYEVVELFIAETCDDPSSVRYLEVELSPHGHHLVLRLEGVRQVVEEGSTSCTTRVSIMRPGGGAARRGFLTPGCHPIPIASTPSRCMV